MAATADRKGVSIAQHKVALFAEMYLYDIKPRFIWLAGDVQ